MGTRLVYAGCCRNAVLRDEDGDWLGEEWLFDRPEDRCGPGAFEAHARRLFAACPDVHVIDVEVIQTPAFWGGPDHYLVRHTRARTLLIPDADAPPAVES